MSMLRVESVSRSYGQIRAVQDVSFEVRAGEIYGLLGPNGAGKTTTISMIAGLLRPDAGTISVDLIDVWGNPRDAKRFLGVVPQDIALYEDLSALENLRFDNFSLTVLDLDLLFLRHHNIEDFVRHIDSINSLTNTVGYFLFVSAIGMNGVPLPR